MRGGVRRDDPHTSFDAAENVDVPKWEQHAMDAAVDADLDGVTTREAEKWMRKEMPGLDARWSLSPRWVSLIKKGIIFRTGATRDGQLIHYATSVFPEWLKSFAQKETGSARTLPEPNNINQRNTQNEV